MTSDLWRFFVDPASVGLGPRLHSALALIVCAACICLICTPVGAHSGKAFLQVGKCSFGTCLKQILTATSFEWSHRWFKVLGENRILVTIQKHIKSVSVVPEKTGCFFLFTSSFLHSLPWPLQKYTKLSILVAFQNNFDIYTCLSAESWGVSWITCILYIFTTTVLSAWSPFRTRREMLSLEHLAKVFMGDIIQSLILIYGRELGCDEQITALATYSNFCFQAGAFRSWFVLSW